ncbi:class II fructose-bisphosphate aldolase [Celerinatantimonas diazotrophica]|uniref:Fructose-bisphosphate aldolase class II n=1 Tax=Celerinatantimonas diazotrophica TaxID=412034 RepID=A0A4R1KBV8_9GAMM|nr:class II fructose-bisphosphate aldolase [Celerinatantimonas diazotrophica]TCK61500.1 fructose-bisphosphate aldolase class II [Celerinatantimonas diazotrophica]CAG9296963.1 D-tagatose-1,6-bisphosphate aldolase subunit GatY [Celerinatantimonas diazotrophica]
MYVSMKQMLSQANQHNYAIMAINCFNLETVRGVISAAQELRAPIIIDIVQEHLCHHCDSKLITPLVIELASRANIDVALNLDHGEDIGLIKKCMVDGFSSVMVDASKYSLAENIRYTKEIVDFAKIYGASVEGELGNIGLAMSGDYTNEAMFTNPDQAKKFIDETGIDALAVSYGSSHGNYPQGMVPELDFDILAKIKQATHSPLVLHGGSGVGADNIKQSVALGINKINVGSDFMKANVNSIQNQLQEHPTKNYWEVIRQAEEQSQEIIKHYISISGSEGKSSLCNYLHH